jgi:Dockerin type I domain
MLIGDAFVHYLEMERLQADHLESLEYVTPNAEDLLKLVESGGGWHELIGTSGDVDLTPLWFQNVADLHLNLANNDQAASDDLLAVSAGNLREHGVEEVRVSSGTGRNQIEVQQGTVRLHASEGGYGVNTDVSVFNESTLVQFGRSQDLHSLEIRSGAEVELIASRSEMYLKTDSLSFGPAKIPDGTIELHDHGLIVDYVGASPLETIQQVIEHARVQNAPIYWTGTGITSRMAADSPDDFEVVAQEVTDAFPDGTGMFHGAKLDGERAAVLVEAATTHDPPLLPGDYNENGTVDAADSVIWRKMLGATVTPYSGADGNGDGLVSDLDYQVWRSHFGATIASSSLNPPPAPGAEELEQLAFSSMMPESLETQATEWGRAAAFEALVRETPPPVRLHRMASHRLHQSTVYLAAVDEALLSIVNNEPQSIVDRFKFSEPLDDSDSRSAMSVDYESVAKREHASQADHHFAAVRERFKLPADGSTPVLPL